MIPPNSRAKSAVAWLKTTVLHGRRSIPGNQRRRNRHQQRPRDLLRLQQERRNAHQHRTCRSDPRRKPVRRVTINLRSLASLIHEGEVPNASSSLRGEVSVLMIALGNRRPTSLILLWSRNLKTPDVVSDQRGHRNELFYLRLRSPCFSIVARVNFLITEAWDARRSQNILVISSQWHGLLSLIQGAFSVSQLDFVLQVGNEVRRIKVRVPWI